MGDEVDRMAGLSVDSLAANGFDCSSMVGLLSQMRDGSA